MCGICGEVSLLGKTAPDQNIIGQITSRMAHRGPDEGSLFFHRNVVLGHRRLSIIDIEKSHQPMASPDKRFVITFNGEIYNYVELRQELERLGHRFETKGDTEVLLRSYIEWRDRMMSRLNGMFAFAIYDFTENTLFMARDRFGQKPLVYSANDHGIIFSSELKPLLLHPRIKHKVNTDHVSDYMVFQNVLPPNTILEGVNKLEAGTTLTYHASDGKIFIARYYEQAMKGGIAGKIPPPDEKDILSCEEKIKSSLSRHLRSDVPVGFYLSGGIDSTVLSLLGKEVMGDNRIKTFTVSHFDPAFDEGPMAKKTSLFLNSEHFEKKMSPDEYERDIMETLTRIDEPIADPGAIASFIVTKHASDTVKVVISGNGGDEFFYGYEPYIRLGLAEKLAFIPKSILAKVFKSSLSLVPDSFGYMGLSFKARIFLEGLAYPEYLRNTVWLAAFSPADIRDALNRDIAPGAENAVNKSFERLSRLYEKYKALQGAQKLSVDFERIYLPDSIASHTDKTSMMHSLEARSPFLDNELTEYANNLPPSWKLSGGTSKWILRKIIQKRLGINEITAGRKRGFTIPVAKLFREEMKNTAEKYFSREITSSCGIFDYAYLDRIWREHAGGKKNHYRKLWTVFTLHHWIKNNLKGYT